MRHSFLISLAALLTFLFAAAVLSQQPHPGSGQPSTGGTGGTGTPPPKDPPPGCVACTKEPPKFGDLPATATFDLGGTIKNPDLFGQVLVRQIDGKTTLMIEAHVDTAAPEKSMLLYFVSPADGTVKERRTVRVRNGKIDATVSTTVKDFQLVISDKANLEQIVSPQDVKLTSLPPKP